MNLVKENKLKILKDFVKICDENHLWYSLDGNTLLLTISTKNFDDNLDHYEVMMTYESYEKLKAKFPQHILDNTKHSEYYSLQNKFVYDAINIFDSQPFLNINLIMPTQIKKIKKYLNCSNRVRSFVEHYATYNNTNAKVKHKVNIAKLLWYFIKKITYKDLINALHEEEFEGYIVTSPFIKKQIYLSRWLSNISFKTKDVIFLGNLTTKVISEYESYLINQYGQNYLDHEIKATDCGYKNPVEIWNLKTLENRISDQIEVSEVDDSNQEDAIN
ncbi:Uncharacterised protein [Metamycoplasma arthritidis]|uniref:LicD-family phosphotransferase n=1 Tax=Metamycoplasma arthritidis (strain 158L3-1) TaxID=243272 RepID=B3PM08_META1|nr:LicD-family phosphotransferase [Metamycoplasma arthritidis]ACF07060.1 LicD-family phosphotransferase [Metamycoplasma arthritidis 158L3-1]VEU78588.1 Uncharacterised protein [Metamycoplasma arthritidis]